jgi:motility quorum-sensing regulator/GCU-specific mRNA interferase toxin
MEKKRPHYSLDAIRQIVAVRRANAFTATALVGAAQLGLSPDEAVEVVLGMKPNAFYKSMTTHLDHTIWQDVYHVTLRFRRVAYVKVTLRENGIVVIQFKEK